MPRFRPIPAVLVGAACAAGSTGARADMASWLWVQGGRTWYERPGIAQRRPDTLQFGLGIGSPPGRTVVVGAALQTTTFFASGTDLALLARAATGGFVRGGWGFALDAGGYERWWGPGSRGAVGAIVLGGPYGLQASVGATRGSNDERAMAVLAGIDLLRLTVYRTGGSWFPNPRPPEVEGSRAALRPSGAFAF